MHYDDADLLSLPALQPLRSHRIYPGNGTPALAACVTPNRALFTVQFWAPVSACACGQSHSIAEDIQAGIQSVMPASGIPFLWHGGSVLGRHHNGVGVGGGGCGGGGGGGGGMGGSDHRTRARQCVSLAADADTVSTGLTHFTHTTETAEHSAGVAAAAVAVAAVVTSLKERRDDYIPDHQLNSSVIRTLTLAIPCRPLLPHPVREFRAAPCSLLPPSGSPEDGVEKFHNTTNTTTELTVVHG